MAQLALPSTKASDDFILDALPYIDDAEYDDSHRKFALSMVEEEQKRYPMTKDYLKKFPKPQYDKFLTPLLQQEFQRINEAKPMPEFDMSRYMVPAPSTSADRQTWVNAIGNCDAQIENMKLKRLNLELMQTHGGPTLVKMNKTLQTLADREEQTVFKLRSQLFETHSRRKRRQEDVRSQLLHMGSQWIVLVNKNIKLDNAIQSAEAELKAMAKRIKIEYNVDPDSIAV
ncbi:unnamed protein product [Bursaphelenchus xylophilus]|uniref:Pre-mRNA-splicing factor SPF27 n=1 Tax=Bursaphelenchus xylophilus TaxID=6326 RepID=A0A1I7RY87_BURXY|nr:unnamed protein product [Bursaphelenchus xylophilus]CAG9085444.1 unnamed protein product [Bursaphelenchus xylophilus]